MATTGSKFVPVEQLAILPEVRPMGEAENAE